MPNDRKEGRRPDRRTFRPTLDGRLEPRLLLSHLVQAQATPRRNGPVKLRSTNGGRTLLVYTASGDRFSLQVTNSGTIRGTRMSNGRVGLVVEGSTDLTVVDVNPLNPSRSSSKRRTSILDIGSIQVTTGRIGTIAGYHTAKLSGPVTIDGTGAVNRLAFQSLDAGAAIRVGGDLDTLDVLGNANLDGGTGINVGRDFNSFSVGQNLTLQNGANIVIGRDLGLTPQGPKGTGPAGQGIFVGGNLVIAAGSSIQIGRDLVGNITVQGSADIGAVGGAPRITIGRNFIGEITVRGTLTT